MLTRTNDPADPVEYVPTATLTNGLTVANFSSPHPFTFTDGTVLAPCSDDRARWYMLNAKEVESPGIKGTTDIELTFGMTDDIARELERVQALEGVDLVIIPLPVMKAMVDAKMDIGSCRSIRMADRVNKVIHHDRWCKS